MAAALAAASSRARTLQTAAGDGPEAERSAALAFAADALTGVTLESAWPAGTVAEMAARVAAILDAPPDARSLELFVRAASSPRLLELPPLLTIELQLRLLLALSPITEVSLWVDETDRQLRCVAHAGGPAPTRRVREIVRAVLDGETTDDRTAAGSTASPVLRWQQPHAALVGRAHPNDRERTRAFLQEAGRCMAPVLEREMLLERSAERERTLAEASERRLMRLGFDLHDGPLQDLAALGLDVQTRARRSAQRVPARARRLVSGRLDDISPDRRARVVARASSRGRSSRRACSSGRSRRSSAARSTSSRRAARRASRSSSAASSTISPLAADHHLPDRAGGPLERARPQRGDRGPGHRRRAAGPDRGPDRGQRRGLPRRAHDDPRREERPARARRNRRARAHARRPVRRPQPRRRPDDAQRQPARWRPPAQKRAQASDSSSMRIAAARSFAASLPSARPT